MVKVKICGITTLDDAVATTEAGADMLGFNFFKRSPRYLTPDAAQQICDRLREQFGEACPLLVGIFVNEPVSGVSNITNKVGLDAAQLSGDESDSMLRELRGIAYKGIQPVNPAMALEDVKYYMPYFPPDERLPSVLVDAYHPQLRGGTGVETSVNIAQVVRANVPRLMLAGGLTPDNIADRVAEIQPWGVDVASGVEQEPGIKDAEKVRKFIAEAQRLD